MFQLQRLASGGSSRCLPAHLENKGTETALEYERGGDLVPTDRFRVDTPLYSYICMRHEA